MKALVLGIFSVLVMSTGCAHWGKTTYADTQWTEVKPNDPLNSGEASVGPGSGKRLVRIENSNDIPVYFVSQKGDKAYYHVRAVAPKQSLGVFVPAEGGTYRFRRTDPSSAGELKPPAIMGYPSSVEEIANNFPGTMILPTKFK